MTASALITSREGTVDPRDRRKSLRRPEPPRDVSALWRWDPWVRAAIAQQVLLAGIHLKADDSSAPRRTVTVAGIDLEPPVRVVITPVPAPPPSPPPIAYDIAMLTAPSVTAFRRQLPLVLSWAELRQERAAEILSQIENQTAFVAAVPYLHPERTPHTIEMLGMAIQLAVNVEVRVKHELACWRPVEYSPHVQPMLTTPGHGSLPSGHATQAYVVAHVLKVLLGLAAQPDHATVLQLERQAARIATNRVIAGVHFPVDSIAGRLLGTALGEYFAARCGQAAGAWVARSFDGSVNSIENNETEFIPSKQSLAGGTDSDFYDEMTNSSTKPTQHPILAELWRLAAAEWPSSGGSWPFDEAPPPPAPPATPKRPVKRKKS